MADEINRADIEKAGGGGGEEEAGKSKIGDRRLSTRDFIRRRGGFCGFTAPQAACTEDANFAVACPLAFYRINLRPIRRTAIFNGSSHNSLLCTVKGQSPSLSLSLSLFLSLWGERGRPRENASWTKVALRRSRLASFLSGSFFHKMAHCCISPPSSLSLGVFLFLSLPDWLSFRRDRSPASELSLV